MVLFFFFKQKTAYEMRISDWSSDVCSSDLGVLVEAGLDAKAAKLRAKQIWHWIYHRGVTDFEAMTDIAKTMRPWLTDRFIIGRPTVREAQVSSDGTRKRSEEHTSELQSLMRISYDVFCLENKKYNHNWCKVNQSAQYKYSC